MFELELDAVLQCDVPVFKAVPKHQAVERDIAVLVRSHREATMIQQALALLGPLPPEVQITTTFSAGIAATSTRPEAVRELLDFLASPATAEAKRRNGMDPA